MENWYIYNELENFNKIRDNTDFTSFQKILLANRGIIDQYKLTTIIEPDIKNMHDPLLLTDMRKAVDILFSSILNNEKVRIVGDYDQDGVAATVILLKGIGLFYQNISYSIPDRVEEGYGINKEIVDDCIKEDIKLIITCDNGISAFEAIEYAKDHDIKVIVTDHHEVVLDNNEQKLPNADAIINPHRLDDKYPFKYICGALVAFKFVQAIYKMYGNELGLDINKINNLIQFAALGTVSDMMEIIDENRIVAVEGLKVLNSSPNLGINFLLKEMNWEKEITIYTIGFLIGPTINSSGRIYTANLGVELFMETDPAIIREYATTLVDLNKERQEMTNKSLDDALNQIIDEKLDNNDIIVLYNNTIHESICGLVAGRIKERFNKPTIVLTDSTEEGIVKGSGRSIKSYDMYGNMSILRDKFISFGGHKMACGLSFKKEYLNQFILDINNNSKLTAEDFVKDIEFDYVLKFSQISFNLIEEIGVLEPFGFGYKEPLFASRNIKVDSIRVLGVNRNVLRLDLNDNNTVQQAITFNVENVINTMGEKFYIESVEDLGKLEGQYIDIVYKLDVNTFRGNTNIQLVLVSMR